MIGRRRVLKAGIVGLGAGVWPGVGLTRTPTGLVLIDPALPEAEVWQARLETVQAVMVERDLVRQWRSTLRERLTSGESAMALVQWDKAFVLTALAREERLRVRQRRIARGVFAVAIG